MFEARSLRRRLAQTGLVTLAMAVALVSVGITASPSAPYSIAIQPVLLRVDSNTFPARTRAFGVDIDVKLWTLHLHFGWPGVLLPPPAAQEL